MSTYRRPRRTSAAPVSVMPPAPVVTPKTGWEPWAMGPLSEPEVVQIQNPALLEILALSEEDEVDALAEQARLEREEQLEKERDEARAQGYESGREQGLKEGLEQGFAQGFEEARVQNLQALSAHAGVLQTMVDQAQAELSSLHEEIGDAIVNLAMRVAEHVVGQTVQKPTPVIMQTVRQILRLNDEQGVHLTFYLNPEVMADAQTQVTALPTMAKVRLIADPTLGTTDVRAKTPYGDIDAKLQTRWAEAMASVGLSNDPS